PPDAAAPLLPVIRGLLERDPAHRLPAPIVDEIGIRSYLGAPLIDRTGMALGTICVVAQEPRPWGRQGLETIKSMAAEMVDQIHRRESGHGI
ncbi:GAF domain-containing protein, partial [Streptomyces sp. NPDC048845]|uniref:GAF domain-containing protein n=1 Tax=Streptomyces sp. NPDC048845 TaxID=3155390 RepID=UPI00344722EC